MTLVEDIKALYVEIDSDPDHPSRDTRTAWNGALGKALDIVEADEARRAETPLVKELEQKLLKSQEAEECDSTLSDTDVLFLQERINTLEECLKTAKAHAPDAKLRVLEAWVDEWMLSEDLEIINTTPEYIEIKERFKKAFLEKFDEPQRKGLTLYAFSDVFGLDARVEFGKAMKDKIKSLEAEDA